MKSILQPFPLPKSDDGVVVLHMKKLTLMQTVIDAARAVEDYDGPVDTDDAPFEQLFQNMRAAIEQLDKDEA